MDQEKKCIISARGLCKNYGSGNSLVKALDNVDLDVFEGELIVVLGNSGCGKSTLLNMLGGMDTFDSGSVIIGGEDLAKMGDWKLTEYRRNRIGFVFQSFNLIAELTSRENVSLTADPSDRKIAEKSLESVGLKDKMNSYPSQLSGGEQQRVAIARALAKNPYLFLCDEPTGALDSETGRTVLLCLEDLVRKQGRTMILVTHNKDISMIADRTVIIKNGRIIEDKKNKKIRSVADINW